MSLRMPQSLSSSSRWETGVSVLEAELAAERAATLGRAGRTVEAALAALRDGAPNVADRPTLLRTAADAVWSYMVQREAAGLYDHRAALEHFAVPPEVMARVGVR